MKHENYITDLITGLMLTGILPFAMAVLLIGGLAVLL